MASDTASLHPRFFVLEKLSEGVHDTEFSTVNLQVGPALRCPHCGDFVSSLTWLPPFQGELELHGKTFADLIKCPGDELMATEQFAHLGDGAFVSARQARASASVLKLLRIVLLSRGEKTWAWKAG